MSGNIKENVVRPSIWLRLVSMIVLGFAFNIAEIVIISVVIFQFLVSLFTGQPNAQLTSFGGNLARYVQQITIFMTFVTEEKPFPFSSWPDESYPETLVAEAEEPKSNKSEKIEVATKNAKASKQRKPAPRRTATKAKPRTAQKKNS